MKSKLIFKWANKRLKIEDGVLVKCMRNNILLYIMNISGVTVKDYAKIMKF